MRHPMSTRLRAERRAAPKPAARWRDASPGRITSALAPLGERRRRLQAALRRPGRAERPTPLAAGRPAYPSDEGHS